MCVFSMLLKDWNPIFKSKLSLNQEKLLTNDFHYRVYYVTAKLLLGEITAYVMYCSL